MKALLHNVIFDPETNNWTLVFKDGDVELTQTYTGGANTLLAVEELLKETEDDIFDDYEEILRLEDEIHSLRLRIERLQKERDRFEALNKVVEAFTLHEPREW